MSQLLINGNISTNAQSYIYISKSIGLGHVKTFGNSCSRGHRFVREPVAERDLN
jgi:hypothetical protein